MILLTAQPSMDLQSCIDLLDTYGGGVLSLNPTSTFYATNGLTIPSDIIIEGNGAVIDFGNTANGMDISGTDIVATGDVGVTLNSKVVTNSSALFTDSMVGQSILIGDYWYEIESVDSDSQITLAWEYIGLTGTISSTYVATTVNNVSIKDLTLQNSTGTIINFYGANLLLLTGLYVVDSVYSIIGKASSSVTIADSDVDFCEDGISLETVTYFVINNDGISNISDGNGITINGTSNSSINIISAQNVLYDALKMSNCSNTGIINYSFIQCGRHGIWLSDGNDSMDFNSGYIDTVGGDGIKIDTNSSNMEITTHNLSLIHI